MKTDSQIREDVMAELRYEPAVDDASIGVIVDDGIVTLSGHVDSYPQRWAAEKAAERVSGVKGLTVQLSVKLPGDNARDDADIAHAARHALDWNSSLARNGIQLVVRDGWITLSGDVDWAYQREAANAAVRDLIGVVGVTNDVRVKSKVQSRDVKNKILAAFHRQAQIDARNVAIDVDGAQVTLSGTVDSWAERAAARDAAWAAPGVWSVVDHMTVGG